MFGRKKRRAADEDELDELVGRDGSDDDPAADPDDTEDEDSGDDAEPEDELDEWRRLDASRDWREEGPFDLSEVDLDADDVERMDFDALILTPFDGMQLQLQVNQQTQQLQALLVVSGQSVMELSLFAAPAGRDMRADVRDEMIANARKAGGKATLTEGPFGTEVRRVVIDLDAPPEEVGDAYLRLHLLSARLVIPNSINLDGIFGILPTVVWTRAGPCSPGDFDQLRRALAADRGSLVITSVDKFPRMVDYVIPSGVRIGDADRIRLGAHLAEGTTVMHEGFVNFNAGTLGDSMIEGRISQGVIVEAGSDIGGGASTMGTLSGGGTQRVRIGRGCLLGAESGCGIALGDNCVIEAGLYVTAGTKVTMPDGSVVPARELSGGSNMLFLRDSVTGAVRVIARAGRRIELNTALHEN